MKIVGALTEENPEIIIVGLTATPIRADKKKMKEVFADITYEKSIIDLIKDGYLADLKLKQVHLDVSIDGVKKTAGDLQTSQIRKIVTRPHIMSAMVDAWKKSSIDRRTIAFAVDVEHANQLAQCFREKDVKSAIIYGDMDNDLRAKRLEDFQKGKLQVLVNCMILTEGWDDIALDDAPPLSCVMLARPTLSQSLYIQQIGRGTRPAPLKKDCLILDFSYNSKRHHIVQLPHLFGLDNRIPQPTGEEQEIIEDGQIESILEAVLAEEESVDISQPPPRAGYRWAESKIGFVLSMGGKYGHIVIRPTEEDPKLFNVFHLEPPEKAIQENRHTRPEEFKEHKLTSKPLTHEWAFGLAEDACRKIFHQRYWSTNEKKMIDKEADWLTLPPTEKQMKLLSRMGKKAETRAEASNIISAMIIEKTYRDREPATKKQKGFLRWKKIPFNEPLTKGEAGRLITEYNRAEKEKQSKRQREMF
jgi:superfamily II DNA or RNA helicase